LPGKPFLNGTRFQFQTTEICCSGVVVRELGPRVVNPAEHRFYAATTVMAFLM
jgi:hypothetical protein